MDDQTFLFADLSGFTALTEAHGDQESAEVASEFAAAVRLLLPTYSGQEVKTIGDAVMVRVAEARAAVHLGLQIVQTVRQKPRFPVVHVGMNTGPAVRQGSDWFGSSVNVAARVSAAAAGDEVLLTKATRDAAGELEDVELDSRGEIRLRNVAEPVHLFRALLRGDREQGLPVDPVCRMAISPGRAAGWLNYAGRRYWLCSMSCIATFAAKPDAVTGQAGTGSREE